MKKITLVVGLIVGGAFASSVPSIAVAQSASCEVSRLLSALESGAKSQRAAVVKGIQDLNRLNRRSATFARNTGDSIDTAYTNALRVVLSIPFTIQSCQIDTTCASVDFATPLASYNQSSDRLRDLGQLVVNNLNKIRGNRNAATLSRRLRKRITDLHSAAKNAASELVATDCRGGRGVAPTPEVPLPDANPLLLTMAGHWNHIAINASGFDHSALGAREQMGPVRSARAEAIVHIAIFDAVNAATGQRYEPFLLQETRPGASVDAAIAYASYETLSKLFPSQTSHFATELMTDLGRIPNGKAKEDGIYLGQQAARLILANRSNDGSDAISQGEPYQFRPGPGFWALDPINPTQSPVGANWFKVRPFVLPSATFVRSQPFPAFTSDEYAEAYNEVMQLGGDGVVTPTIRTQDQTEAGIFWAYDGTPSLCAPPRLYNQVALHLAHVAGITDVVELTRMLALVNLAMSDAGVASWDTKYHYSIARPITAIRRGNEDGNSKTVGDPRWTPLGAPATNLNGPNFSPPFPAYVSGHATFGGAMFQIMRNVIGTDSVPFTFVSDELNGVTPGNDGIPRPKRPRSYTSLSQAEEENGQSRIYLGIHWKQDKVEGIRMGRTVANYVFRNIFRKK